MPVGRLSQPERGGEKKQKGEESAIRGLGGYRDQTCFVKVCKLSLSGVEEGFWGAWGNQLPESSSNYHVIGFLPTSEVKGSAGMWESKVFIGVGWGDIERHMLLQRRPNMLVK